MSTFKTHHNTKEVHGYFKSIEPIGGLGGALEVRFILNSQELTANVYFNGGENRFGTDPESVFHDLEDSFQDHGYLSEQLSEHINHYVHKLSVPSIIAWYNAEKHKYGSYTNIFLQDTTFYTATIAGARAIDSGQVFDHANDMGIDYNHHFVS